MGRYKNIINEIKLNKEIKRWRKIEADKVNRQIEKNIVKNSFLTKEEKNQIDDFYKKFTKKKICYFWHLKYKTVSGNFCDDYFPELYYNADLKHRLNDKKYIDVYSNKFVLAKIINGANIGVISPKNIVVCNNGFLIDENDNVITESEGINRIIKAKSVFCKKSIGTYGGDDCILLKNPINKEVDKLFHNYGNNFLVQEVIENQDDLKKLNPSTLNTFRIITFYASGEFRTSPIILRIGRINQFIDNAHAGGMFVGVDDNGTIVTDAKNVQGQTFIRHPDSNIVFKGYKIANVNKVREKAIQLAYLFPQTKLIDWDLTIDKNGNVICVEANIDTGSIWLMQMSHGTPVFKEHTVEMLQYVHIDNIFKIIKKNLKRT